MSSEGSDPSASGSASAVDPLIGQIIDKRYQLTRKLGEGGMGEVYAADHLRIARSVAIKLLRPEVLTNEEAVKRFEQEAMTASSIGHENIIRIEDSGKLEDGRIYLAMELLDGLPFNDLIDQPTPVPPNRLLNILIQTCHGLAAAHNKGIVHRDMKPENIYITQGGDGADLPKLLDFGIAKVSQAEGENHLTRTGTIFGTPFYMAPEQALGQGVDHRVDIYAMGVIMYEVFCGVVPFGGESFMGILTQHITAEPVLPSQTAAQNGRTLPPGVEDVIVRSMKKEPSQRYQSMDELVDALIPIYRGLAGAGMSTYMEAHTPDPAYMVPAQHHAPTPMSQQASGGYAPSGPAPQHPPVHNPAHDTGQPYQAGPPHMGTAPPAGGHYGAQASGSYAGASDSLMMPARKSRAGLIIAIFLLLCGAGGAAAFFMFAGDDDKTEDPIAKSDPSKDPTTDPVNSGNDDVADASSTGATTVNNKPIDAGVADAKKAVELTTDPLDPPEPVLISVVIESSPDNATVWKDGKKLGTTATLVKVAKGETTTFILKRKGYHDLSIDVDGSETKTTGRLEKKGRKHNNNNTIVKPPPDKDPPKDPPKDPKDECKRNPNLIHCILE